jgi:outer membrane protein assembly factor BamB
VRAYRLETDARGESKLIRVWSADAGQTEEGTSPAVTNGVLFVAMDGAIVALEANSGKQLWSSASAGSRGSIGSVHWQSPIVAEGSVYCADQNGNLSAYGVP